MARLEKRRMKMKISWLWVFCLYSIVFAFDNVDEARCNWIGRSTFEVDMENWKPLYAEMKSGCRTCSAISFPLSVKILQFVAFSLPSSSSMLNLLSDFQKPAEFAYVA